MYCKLYYSSLLLAKIVTRDNEEIRLSPLATHLCCEHSGPRVSRMNVPFFDPSPKLGQIREHTNERCIPAQNTRITDITFIR